MGDTRNKIEVSGGEARGIIGANKVEVGQMILNQTNVYQWQPDTPPTNADTEIISKIISPRRVFIQYINPEIIRLYGIPQNINQQRLCDEALMLTRYALLLSDDKLIMPISYVFEVPFIDKFLMEITPILDYGLLYVASPTPDWEKQLEVKITEYSGELHLFPGYTRKNIPSVITSEILKRQWIPRVQRSSGKDISELWTHELYKDTGLWKQIQENVIRRQGRLPNNLDLIIEKVPERLEGKAFIHRYATSLLPISLTPSEDTRVSMFISKGYMESYLEEYDAMILADTSIGILDCGLPQFSASGRLRKISFRSLRSILALINLPQYIDHHLENSRLKWRELIELRECIIFRWFMDCVLKNMLNPIRPLEMAILKSRYKPLDISSNQNFLQVVKDNLERLFDAVDSLQLTYSHP